MGKRRISDKYIRCACDKNSEILVGMKMYIIANILYVFVVLFFTVIFALYTTQLSYEPPLLLALLMSGFGFLCWTYIGAKRQMLAAGHTLKCSKRAARFATLYFGTWSDFKIIENNKEKTK